MTAMHDGDADARDRAEHGDAGGADDRQPEFPLLDPIDAREVGELEQADRRRDHHCGEGRVGQVLEQLRRATQQQRDSDRAHDAGQLRLRARPLRPPACATSCC